MVDAVVSFAVEKLGDFLIQQAVFLRGIEGEVEWLQNELRFMRSFLKDADQKQGSDENIRTWISVIQDIAFDTEDIIETFMFKVNKVPIHSSKWGRMSSSMKNRFCCICNNAKLYDIGKDIEDLKKRVLEITRQRETYGINNSGIIQNNVTRGGGGGSRITTSYGDEDLDVVGFEDDFQQLQAKLFDDTQSRSVISILGMGGLGKTTLARKLYNDNKTNDNKTNDNKTNDNKTNDNKTNDNKTNDNKTNDNKTNDNKTNDNKTKFTKHAWICVSQEWKTEDLLEKLIKSFVELTKEEREKVDKMKLFELEPYLRNLLEKHQYLVVIDDLWHREAWESIKNAFPDNKNGSRIIITTRKENVASPPGHKTYVHKLRFLHDEESWSLLCKKAFPDKNGVCPDDLVTLGKEMTAKCRGLPLAIVVLGGLLSRKEFHEWPEVKEHIWREIKEDSINDISPILDLSYNDLPINLKSCFLYLAIFPVDASIEVEELVMLWVAEQFIPIDEEGNRTLEEVSEYYFKELLGRNLVQTMERNWRMTSKCRVHDLVRDLAIKKARETNFICVHDQIGSSSSLRTTSCRRFVVHHEELLNHLHKKVCTLHLLNVSIDWSFRLLRVLQLERVDLSGERESRFVEGVGEMIHLRYLGLKKTDLDKLPNTIGNLKVLQTLYVNDLILPKDIGKLKELRHLIGGFHVEDCPNFAGLSNLQTLKLKLLGDTTLRVNNLDFLATLNKLRTLEIDAFLLANRRISIESLLSCNELIELKIMGEVTIREVPKDIHKYLTKLKYLMLQLSHKSEEDPIPKLEKLPNLLVLHLSYKGKIIAWTFTAKGFPQLEFFKLGRIFNTLHVDEGAMPRLRFLCLKNDEIKRTHFPERFWSLPGEKAMNWKFTKFRT